MMQFHFNQGVIMKKVLALIAITLLSTSSFAAIKCVPSGNGTCCWDTVRDGPFKPIGC
jgi:hypothetical protein